MKKALNYTLTIIICTLIFSCTENQKDLILNKTSIPVPTEVIQNMNNEEQYENRREEWLELIHKASPTDDWRLINKQNLKDIFIKRNKFQQKTVEQFANGLIEGEWIERGGSNQAGNLMNVDFEKNSELIYGIAVNGSVWKSNLNGTSWHVLNNDIVFDSDIIKVIEISVGQRRIFVSNGKQIMYSDDEGLTWLNANGFGSSNGKAIDLVKLNDSNNSLIYLYYDGSTATNKIAISLDNGVTFTDEQSLVSTNSSGRRLSLAMFNNGIKAYILDANNGIYIFENGIFNQVNTGGSFGSGSYFKLQATATPTDTVLFVLKNKSILYKSTDQGVTFNLVSNLPLNSWNVGIEVAEDDPNAVYFGEVELYHSTDGGVSYSNTDWSDYYNDVVNDIHADITRLKSFVKIDGTEFCLICNHGGISISYDHLVTKQNIGLSNLNIGQFYDVISNPIDGNRLYGGTQDQGLQYTNTADIPGVLPLEQAISGDYGHMQISNNGQILWAQYPGAVFYTFSGLLGTPGFGGIYDLDGLDMPATNWMVPTASAPNISDDFIYVAGGDVAGGSGSHLIKLQYLGFNNIGASQFSFDFKAASGTKISAVNASKVDTDKLYVGTENGKFYFSNDNGVNWGESNMFSGPGILYLYGASIVSANQTSGLVFFGGSGYSNSPCFMSTDGGQNFTAISNGLPSTVIHDMAMSPDDNFVYAATDAGPYVYSILLNEWFYIGGITSPVGKYYSVDYVNSKNIVRFGTHGRGIWDLNLLINDVGVNENQTNNWSVYPNPVINSVINISANQNSNDLITIQLYDLQGRLIYKENYKNNYSTVKLPTYVKGNFILTISNKSELLYSHKIVVQ